MLVHVVERAEQALLLARPEGEADGALRPARRCWRRIRAASITTTAASTIVGGTVARDPTVEVRARHHVAGLRVRAGHVRDDVVGVGVVVEVARVDVELEHRIVAHLRHARDAAIIFGGDLHGRELGRAADLVLIALARHQLAVSTGHCRLRNGAFAREERIKVAGELQRA